MMQKMHVLDLCRGDKSTVFFKAACALTVYPFIEVNNMGLDKSIQSGKEHRKQYTGAKAGDAKCRNHGSCKWCHKKRIHKNEKRKLAVEQSQDEHLGGKESGK